MSQSERLDFWTPEQAQALRHLLEFIALNDIPAVENNMIADDLFRTLDELENPRSSRPG